jgi:uncharacterized membrane protein HdeD (DUF308 family)
MAETSSATIYEAEVHLVPWWLILLEGLAALIIGIMLVVNPVSTTILLVQILGWYWLIMGIITLVSLLAGVLGICFGAISLFWALKAGWGAAIMGILSIIFGLLLLGSPYTGVVLLVYLLAVLGIVGGIITIYMAIKLRSA